MKEVWKPLPTVPIKEVDEYGACSSKSVINSLTIPNESKNGSIADNDDLAIAQLLQAEFDMEYDEQLKRLEQSRNKSKIVIHSSDSSSFFNILSIIFRLKNLRFTFKISTVSG